MDTFRGNFVDRGGPADDSDSYDPAEDDTGRATPPDLIGQDERRMQVRAYNHWASLLEDRNFPAIDDLDPSALPDFGPYSVLLDFTAGIENPGIAYLGAQLARECGAGEGISELAEVPSRSLLSRITDHYMQILANQAPIGFEAEFVNQRGQTILYRGILLPFSSDDDTIDFIYGVINWKELADQRATDELMLEIEQVLDEGDAAPAADMAGKRADDGVIADWADGPVSGAAGDDLPTPSFGGIVDLPSRTPLAREEAEIPLPHFGPHFGDEAEMELADWLALARELAELARSSEDRSRGALYEAISRAYDFSLAAAAEPGEFAELLEASGLAMQERAPMTPVVKLVFGADYDKTRLTEYAAALMHAHRLGLERGALGAFLSAAEGGLKGVVQAERRLRREEAGKPAGREEPRARIARKLRSLEPVSFAALPAEGQEFGLVMIRRLPGGEVGMLGEIPDDAGLIERAAKKLVG